MKHRKLQLFNYKWDVSIYKHMADFGNNLVGFTVILALQFESIFSTFGSYWMAEDNDTKTLLIMWYAL